jgi:hypothetical protein
MKIGRIRRLRIAFSFWRALGDKDGDAVLAVVHECGFVDISSGNLSVDVVKTMRTEAESAGYDYEHKTT